MASAIYPKTKEKFLQADIDLSAVTLRAVLIDTGTYTYSTAHEAYDDLSGVVGTESDAVGNKTFTNGVLDGDNITFTSVTGNTAEALVIFVDSGTASTDWLIAFIDSASSGLPATPNGGNITITWNASGIFAL